MRTESFASGSSFVVLRSITLAAALGLPPPSATTPSTSAVVRNAPGHGDPQDTRAVGEPDTKSGWARLMTEVTNWSPVSDGYVDADGERVTSLALAALRRVQLRAAAKLTRPDAWGADGDDGIFVEQHGERTVLLRIDASGLARLSVFQGLEREGAAEILS